MSFINIYINRKKLLHNITVLKTLNEIDNKYDKKFLFACIKANAYGHGLAQIAKILYDHVEMYCVADAFEYHELINQNIFKPTLLLYSYNQEILENCQNYKYIRFCPNNLYSLKEIANFATTKQIKLKIHLQFNTGMSWAGLEINEIDEAIKIIQDCVFIDLEGIWTHFATSDNSTDYSYYIEQGTKFQQICEIFKTKNINLKYIHANNTGGILNDNSKSLNQHCNSSRTGIGLYGYYPDKGQKEFYDQEKLNLKPILELTCKPQSINLLKTGESLGYGNTFKTKKQTVIANLPIGYSHGLSRNHTNSGQVMITNSKELYPIIGRVSMNACFIDITDYCLQNQINFNSHINDKEINKLLELEFSLINDDINCDTWADIDKTISYEVLTRLNSNIPRSIIE